MSFSVDVTVRGYELDTQGHLNRAGYLQYAEHARRDFAPPASRGTSCRPAASGRWPPKRG